MLSGIGIGIGIGTDIDIALSAYILPGHPMCLFCFPCSIVHAEIIMRVLLEFCCHRKSVHMSDRLKALAAQRQHDIASR